ncbi:MAG: DEAD/DEAH box helicase [Candidatus Woesearchaeota archaeon]|nr:DEAD/DEAH box helicase [Candidatus Woesearchaeota archaeon]
MVEFRGLTLDRFQVEATQFLTEGHSVVVSAATGTGKTIIADYVIDKAFTEGKKVFYTSPIKALSNQKFSEFKQLYGDKNVGILTGDVVQNPTAPLLIMTTEIYRNMLLADDPITDHLKAVVFDEIHFLGDKERGTVWEEAIIFSPEHVRFLCLSATIPNARQFANWIQAIKHHDVKVVTEKKRAVPLQHQFYDIRFGMSTLKEIKQRKHHPNYKQFKKRGRRTKRPPKLTHLDLIKQLRHKQHIPCIYFCFSRAATQDKADELAQRTSFLTKEQQQKVHEHIDNIITDPDVQTLETTHILCSCLERGVAFHHAGILPVLKELVEVLFAEKLVFVLYATETFAVGINLPTKTVCFNSLEKYDGIEFRYLHSREYFQLAGRAGRRGLDKIGYAISVIDPEYADLNTIANMTAGDTDPLQSQYKLSYNTVLNLVANHTPAERETILTSSLYTYQTAGKHAERIVKQFHKKKQYLEDLDYIKDDKVTERGEFARKVYQAELMLTELFMTSLTEHFSDFQMMLLCAALEFEPRPNMQFRKKHAPATKELLVLFKEYPGIYSFFKKRRMEKIEPMLAAWYNGKEFIELLDLTTMPEGDIIRFFRRIIDVIQQVQHATQDASLRHKLKEIVTRIDRGIVQVHL